MANVYLEYQNFLFPRIRECNRVSLINSSKSDLRAVYDVFHYNHLPLTDTYLAYQNFFFFRIRKCNRISLINSSTDAPYAIYDVFHHSHQLLRSCSKINTIVFRGVNEQINLRINYALISVSTQQIHINAEGMVDDSSLIKRLFDSLPNYFSSIEEQENED